MAISTASSMLTGLCWASTDCAIIKNGSKTIAPFEKLEALAFRSFHCASQLYKIGKINRNTLGSNDGILATALRNNLNKEEIKYKVT